MREIKFRGLSLNGSWHYGLPTILTQDLDSVRKAGTYISNRVGVPMAYAVRPETLSEYTGLLDKNGKEIYEGDIVESYLNGVSGQCEIKYKGSGFCAESSTGRSILLHGINDTEIEIIGNIYENHELLGGSNDGLRSIN
jgi:uncharacterized phage protein (TIGR01671 family)